MTRARHMRTAQRKGMAFVVVLWIVVAMAAVAIAVSAGARTRTHQAASVQSSSVARAAEAGALRYVLAVLGSSSGQMPDETQLVSDGVIVGDSALWIIRPSLSDDRQRELGLVDETGKIDINTAPQAILERLPNMTPEIAAAIVDWRDGDEDVTPGGAESQFYQRERGGYNAKNAPFETVQELRMVAGVDDEILYGEDTNRSGVLEDYEDDGAATAPDDDRDGRLDRGLAGVTSASVRWPQEQGKTNINTASRDDIESALEDAVEGDDRADQLAEQIMERRPFASIFHFHFRCNLSTDEFAALEPAFTTHSSGGFRLNVNAAGREALAALPGLEEADVEALLAARQGRAEQTESLAWMIDAIDREKLLTAAAAGVTGRGWQYTADIVAVSGDGRAFRRVRYIIDISGGSPRVVHRLDLTHCGWPLDPTILDLLRAGERIEDVLTAVKEL